MSDIDDIADRLTAAIEAGDREALSALYADHIIVWHNTDGIEMTKAQNLDSLDALVAMTTSRSFDNIRRHHIADGFVQQHVMRLTWPNGSGDLPTCIVVRIEGEQIARVDEYLDAATVASFR